MRLHTLSVAFAAILIARYIPAQITASVTALAPITTTAADGPASVINTQPAGPLPPSLFTHSSVLGTPGGTHVFFQSGATTSTTSAYFNCGLACNNVTASASTSTNTIEILVTFSAQTSAPVQFRILPQPLLIPPGATAPQIQVDVDNDGTIDWVNGTSLAWFPPRTIGPLPLQFRVVLDGSLQQIGELINEVSIEVTPFNDLAIDSAVIGCVTHGPLIEPSFLDRGIRIRNASPAAIPTVVVLGLQMQPALLPATSLGPCLLLPRPDVVLPFPSFTTMELGLPASVRPVTIWAQSVQLLANGAIGTGYGTRVTAN